LKADPDFAMAHAALGGAYYSYIYNMPAEGKRHFEKALALSERTTERERLIIQADFASDLGHFQETAERYQVYLRDYPDDWRSRNPGRAGCARWPGWTFITANTKRRLDGSRKRRCWTMPATRT